MSKIKSDAPFLRESQARLLDLPTELRVAPVTGGAIGSAVFLEVTLLYTTFGDRWQWLFSLVGADRAFGAAALITIHACAAFVALGALIGWRLQVRALQKLRTNPSPPPTSAEPSK